MSQRLIHKLARLIHGAAWGVTKMKYTTGRESDWRSKDARRSAEAILTHYDVIPKKR